MPTPCARDGKGAGHQTSSLPSLLQRTPQLAQLLPTPRARDGKGVGRDTLPGLIQPWAAVRQSLLPTPRASDGAKGSPAQRGSKKDLTLPSAAVQLLPTPTAARYGRNKSPSAGAAIRLGLDAIGELVGPPHESSDAAADGPMWGRYQVAISRWEAIIGRQAPPPTQAGSTGSPVLAPPLVEWLMGLPAGWVTDSQLGLARTAALRVLGNGVVPQQAALALGILLCPHRWQAT